MKKPLSINHDFVVISPEKKVSIETHDETLYPRLDKTYNGFVGHELISCFEFDSDWTSWEVHPHGDEIVMLMSGRITLVLQLESGESSLELSGQGQYAIVPQGVWHTAKISVASKVLFITPGQGTQHKDI